MKWMILGDIPYFWKYPHESFPCCQSNFSCKCETQHFGHLLLSDPLTWRFFLERSPPFQNVLGIPMPNGSTTTTTTDGTLMVESELLTFVIKLLTPVVKVSTSSCAHVEKTRLFLVRQRIFCSLHLHVRTVPRLEGVVFLGGFVLVIFTQIFIFIKAHVDSSTCAPEKWQPTSNKANQPSTFFTVFAGRLTK